MAGSMEGVRFHQRCGKNISLSPDRRVARYKVTCYGGAVFSAHPLGETTFSVQVMGTHNNKPALIALGVTAVNPANMRGNLDLKTSGSPSWFLIGDILCHSRGAADVSEMMIAAPCLLVSAGDTVGVKHADGRLEFFKNGSLHFSWDVQIPGPVWARVVLYDVTGVSVVQPDRSISTSRHLPTSSTGLSWFLSMLTSSMGVQPDDNVPATMPRWEAGNKKRIYRMTSSPRGFCVIVNMYHVYGIDEPRIGSENDVTNLQRTWANLGYDVLTWIDKDAEDLVRELKTLSQDQSLSSHPSFVLILMSHGNKGHILGSDRREIKLGDIFWMFSNVKCPNLRNKPKLFFIQACRGDKRDRDLSDADPELASDAMNLPEISDMLVMYGTISGYKSWRNHSEGSYLIKSLTKVLDERCRDTNLTDMLTEVIRTVRGGNRPGIQSPIYKSTLAKQLWFYPV